MKLLAMDISTTGTGYALFENGEYKESGVVKSPGKVAMNRYYGLCCKMDELFSRLQMKDGDTVVVEGAFMRKNFKTTQYLLKLQGHAEYLSSKYGAKFDTITTSTWRGVLGFPTNFKKTQSAIYKQLSIQYTSDTIGKLPNDDNEADAVCIGMAFMKKDGYVPKRKRKASKTEGKYGRE